MKKNIIIILSVFLLMNVQGQTDTLTVMQYNLLNFPTVDPDRIEHLESINQYILPDIFLVNELVNISGAQSILDQTLNVNGINHYSRATYIDGFDTDNMLYFDHTRLALLSQDVITTDLRDISEYILYYLSDDLAATEDTIFIYIYVAHLKAGSEPENEQQRGAEIAAFRNHLNNISDAENILLSGDFNFYHDNEPAYQAIIDDPLYPLNDPVQPSGTWHFNPYYSDYHTQSTRIDPIGGGAGGGMDDRFDFIFYSDDVMTGSNKVTYLENSFEAFGNDGNHYNQNINDPPLNPAIPSEITNALYNMSDHLPVLLQLKVEASIDTTIADLAITEIMYNPPEAGDTLEFIEVMNIGTTLINIEGYHLSNAVEITFPGVQLAPGECILAAGNPQAIFNTFEEEAYLWSGGLSNGGEEILLTNPSGLIIDQVAYDDALPWPLEADGDGYSLALCDPLSDNSLAENWSLSQHLAGYNQAGDPIYASPGYPECQLPPIADFSADQTEILEGETVQFTDLSLNQPTSWSWVFDGGIPNVSDAQHPSVTYPTAGIYPVQLTVANDEGSDMILKDEYITVSSDEDPQLIITEIMQNPSSVNDAVGEWFEVFNPTSNPVNMNGYIIKDNDYDYMTISGDLIVPPQGFAVLGASDNPAENGNYQCNYAYAEFYLANSNDEIIILLPDGITELDRVVYNDATGWPDPSGHSMVFTGTPLDDNNIFSNWTTASQRELTFSGTGDDGSPGTNGWDQHLLSTVFFLDLTVLLEGPYDNGYMRADLITLPDFPFTQPYSGSPWNYGGTESVSALPSTTIVDWLLIEIREATDAGNAGPGSMISQSACFLLNNGLVRDLDGSSLPQFSGTIEQYLYAVIYHRNHLGIITSEPLSLAGNTYSYNFTTSAQDVLGGEAGYKYLGNDHWGMVAGNTDGSGIINISDLTALWYDLAGEQGYFLLDADLDTQVNNHDKDSMVMPNLNKVSGVPE